MCQELCPVFLGLRGFHRSVRAGSSAEGMACLASLPREHFSYPHCTPSFALGCGYFSKTNPIQATSHCAPSAGSSDVNNINNKWLRTPRSTAWKRKDDFLQTCQHGGPAQASAEQSPGGGPEPGLPLLGRLRLQEWVWR